MKPALRVLVLLCCLLAIPLAVSAQDIQGVDLGDGYAIAVPADWEVTDSGDSFTIVGDGVTLTVTTPAQLEAQGITFDGDSTVEDALALIITELTEVDPDSSEILVTTSDGRALASLSNRAEDSTDEMLYAVQIGDGEFGYLNFTVPEAQLALVRMHSKPIINSFVVGEPVAATASSTPCAVSAETADTAELRVGPGTNRGVISFLPANTDVTATGRIALEDGTIWYQLDKAEAAPGGTPASELWVWEEQVTLDGDCENVGATNAPPVVRAAPQVVSPPAGESASIPNATAGGASTPVPGLLQPTAGVWTLTIDPVINASCEGTQNAPIPSSEVYEEVSFIISVSNIDTDRLVFNGDLFTRYPGSNSFDGMVTFTDGTQDSGRVDIITPTTIRGEINDLFIYDGFQCSATTLFGAAHN